MRSKKAAALQADIRRRKADLTGFTPEEGLAIACKVVLTVDYSNGTQEKMTSFELDQFITSLGVNRLTQTDHENNYNKFVVNKAPYPIKAQLAKLSDTNNLDVFEKIALEMANSQIEWLQGYIDHLRKRGLESETTGT